MPGLRLETIRHGRRTFLALTAGAGAAVAAAVGLDPLPATLARAADLDPAPFCLGVASGDPDHESVVLWTRLVTDPFADDGGMPDTDVEVHWEIARDEQFQRGYRSGTVIARPAELHSVHVVTDQLRPDSWFYYRFSAELDVQSATSRVGRTRTMPAPGARARDLTFGFVSCQAWTGGRYASYRDLAEHDLDLVIHLGDYIYETTNGSLTEFRRLHSLYKTSPELREAHARFPFITTWDDHEVQNNYADDIEGNAGDGRPFLERRANAYQAYWEHLPLRPSSEPDGEDMLLYRRFDWGRLARLSVLDTRQYRDDQACGDGRRVRCEAAEDPSRTMTGPEQEQWLLDGLSTSRATWNVIAQQTIMAQFDYDLGPDLVVNLDQWDGYPAARQRILDHLAAEKVANPIVLAGDWHTAWCNHLLADFDDPDSAVIGTEFVGTSISSGAGWDASVRAGLPANPHVQFYNGSYRGWTMCQVTPADWTTTYRIVLDAGDADSPAYTIATYRTEAGSPGAVRVGDPDGLSGTVTGPAGAIRNAEVIIDGPTRVAITTGADGSWFAFAPAGSYQITISAIGYETVTRSIELGDEPAVVDGELTPISGARVSHRPFPGLREAASDDLVLENAQLALAISVASQDSQLQPVTPGKPRNAAAAGFVDQLDWINLPYAGASRPSGAEAWQSLTVQAERVEALEYGPAEAVVRATGSAVSLPLEVVTDYRLAADAGEVEITSTFTNPGSEAVTAWIGDAIDHDGAGQRSIVPGHGLIQTPYAEQHSYIPDGDWMAMTGTDGQIYALHYTGDFTAYGNGNWIQSQREVTINPGASVELRRRLVIGGDQTEYLS